MTTTEIARINIHNGCDGNEQATLLLQPLRRFVAATNTFTVHRVTTTQKPIKQTHFVAKTDVYYPTSIIRHNYMGLQRLSAVGRFVNLHAENIVLCYVARRTMNVVIKLLDTLQPAA